MKLCMLAIFAVCVCVCVDYRHWFVSVYLPFFVTDIWIDLKTVFITSYQCFYNCYSVKMANVSWILSHWYIIVLICVIKIMI